MREIRLYGSEGGGAEANRLSLPLSSATLRVVRVASGGIAAGTAIRARSADRERGCREPRRGDAERRGRHSHADRGNE
jgi:hypothetical protein